MDGRCATRDPIFARRFAVVSRALHNICERHKCAFEDRWLPYESACINNTLTRLVSPVVGSTNWLGGGGGGGEEGCAHMCLLGGGGLGTCSSINVLSFTPLEDGWDE